MLKKTLFKQNVWRVPKIVVAKSKITIQLGIMLNHWLAIMLKHLYIEDVLKTAKFLIRIHNCDSTIR